MAGKFNWEHMVLCSRLFYLCFPWRTPQRNPCARLMVTRCVTYLPGFKGRTMRTLLLNLHTSAFHCSELDESEIDLSQKRSECEHSNVNWDRSKRVWTRLQREPECELRSRYPSLRVLGFLGRGEVNIIRFLDNDRTCYNAISINNVLDIRVTISVHVAQWLEHLTDQQKVTCCTRM